MGISLLRTSAYTYIPGVDKRSTFRSKWVSGVSIGFRRIGGNQSCSLVWRKAIGRRRHPPVWGLRRFVTDGVDGPPGAERVYAKLLRCELWLGWICFENTRRVLV